MPSMILVWYRPPNDNGVILSAHSVRRNAASASRNDGVAFFRYHGRAVQVALVPLVVMCQVQLVGVQASKPTPPTRRGPPPMKKKLPVVTVAERDEATRLAELPAEATVA